MVELTEVAKWMGKWRGVEIVEPLIVSSFIVGRNEISKVNGSLKRSQIVT